MKGKRMKLDPRHLDRLAEELRSLPRQPVGEHCAENELLGYSLDLLSPHEIEAAETHLVTCADCSAKLSALLQLPQAALQPDISRRLARLRAQLLEETPAEPSPAAPAHPMLVSGLAAIPARFQSLAAALQQLLGSALQAEWKERLENWDFLLRHLIGGATENQPFVSVTPGSGMERLLSMLPVSAKPPGVMPDDFSPDSLPPSRPTRGARSRQRRRPQPAPRRRRSITVQAGPDHQLQFKPRRQSQDYQVLLTGSSSAVRSLLLLLIPLASAAFQDTRVVELKRARDSRQLTALIRDWDPARYMFALEPSRSSRDRFP